MALVKLVVRAPKKHAETLSECLFEAGAGGVEERENGRELVVYAASREEADGMAERTREAIREALAGVAGISLKVEVDENSDWDTAWTKHLGQVELTSKIVIQPVWDETPAPQGSARILYQPELAFGDGAHVTTRLAARALERACSEFPQARVLDFGSGSGVLAFVALLSGAKTAWGVDIDPVSVAAATHNAELNALSERARFALPSELGATEYDIVVANLEAPALLAVAGEIARLASAAKRLILTGFLEPRAPEIVAAFAAEFTIVGSESAEDWALLELCGAASAALARAY
ncbi:MAG TPA: 50S ribosomal protein L11 methyltransferase [Polyangiaceae bacterium]|nr:50S ribosomal protein L11 methyltransferase [Polyangiaceae bacterium]